MTTVRLLDAATAGRLRAQPATYRADADADDPRYHRLERTHPVRSRRTFDELADALLRWQVHRGAGLRVAASDLVIVPGTVVLQHLLVLAAPCRVVTVLDEPHRRGFTYVTLPGHPESGEETFALEQRDDGSVGFTISAVSRPASRLARLGGPASGAVQSLIIRRYLHALDD